MCSRFVLFPLMVAPKVDTGTGIQGQAVIWLCGKMGQKQEWGEVEDWRKSRTMAEDFRVRFLESQVD